MRPALKSFIYFDRHPEGVLFRTGSEAFVLKGSGIYPVVARLVELLDGRHNLDAIAEKLPPKILRLFETLLKELLGRGFVVDRGEASLAASALESTFGSVIAFLSDHGPDALPTFERWHRRPLIVGGSGRILDSLVSSLLDLGVGNLFIYRDLTLVRTSGCEHAISESHARDACQRIEFIDHPDGLHISQGQALYASDVLDPDGISRFEQAVQPTLIAGERYGHVIVVPGVAQLPFAELSARLNRSGDAKLPASAAQLSLAGSLLAFEWFKIETNITENTFAYRGKLISSDLTIVDFPIDPVRFAESEVPTEHPERDLSEFERFWEHLKPLFHETTGIFSVGKSGGLPQLPLYHQEIIVRTRDGNTASTLLTWGLGVEDAGLRTIKWAAEHYVSHGRNVDTDAIVARAAYSRDEAVAALSATTAYLDQEIRAHAILAEIDFDHVSHEALILARLAKAMSPGDLRVTRLEWRDRSGSVVTVARDDDTVVWAAEARWEDALIEALGSYCSSLQLGRQRQTQFPVRPGAFNEGKFDSISMFAAFGIHVCFAGRSAT